MTAGRVPVLPFRNAEIKLPDPPEAPALLTVKVSLRGAKPPVHDVVQQAMGWFDSHLHRFYPGTDDRGSYFVTGFDLDEGDDGTPEDAVRLDQLLRAPGDRIRYEYDFGDGWSHDLTLEQVA